MSLLERLKPYGNRRVVAILLLSFSSGLPLALTGSTLQAWYTVSGVSLLTIGALTLVGQPYVWKFLWAPVIDRFVPIDMGRRRSWIFIMQFLMVIALSIMAFLNPKTTPWLLASIALGVAFFSASQDTAIDAYRTDLLPAEERGQGAAVNTIGYRVAMLVSGALALILAGEIGWRATYLIMAGLLVVEMFITYKAPNPTDELAPPQTLLKAVVEPWKEFATRKNAALLIIFIIIYKICDAFALSLNTAFLIRGVGFSLIEIGSVAKIVSLVAALLGSFIGGALLPRMGLYRSLMVFGFLQMASNLSFALLAIMGKSITLMAGVMFTENFCSSLGTVAFVVFLMTLCNKRYTATQYALLSALASVGRVFIGPIAAVVVDHVGWVQFYIWSFLIGIPALFLLWWMRNHMVFSSREHA